jgi:hypothetical protein
MDSRKPIITYTARHGSMPDAVKRTREYVTHAALYLDDSTLPESHAVKWFDHWPDPAEAGNRAPLGYRLVAVVETERSFAPPARRRR